MTDIYTFPYSSITEALVNKNGTIIKETYADELFELGFNKSDVKGYLDIIKKTDVAEVCVGRRGHKTRIIWKKNFDNKDNNTNNTVEEKNIFTHSFILREGWDMQITLPRDITKAEADRMALFIQSLPFPIVTGD